MNNQSEKPALKIALAWIFVSLPLLWGVSQTLIKATALFK
jgi:hypothetical protein